MLGIYTFRKVLNILATISRVLPGAQQLLEPRYLVAYWILVLAQAILSSPPEYSAGSAPPSQPHEVAKGVPAKAAPLPVVDLFSQRHLHLASRQWSPRTTNASWPAWQMAAATQTLVIHLEGSLQPVRSGLVH